MADTATAGTVKQQPLSSMQGSHLQGMVDLFGLGSFTPSTLESAMARNQPCDQLLSSLVLLDISECTYMQQIPAAKIEHVYQGACYSLAMLMQRIYKPVIFE